MTLYRRQSLRVEHNVLRTDGILYGIYRGLEDSWKHGHDDSQE